jgi:hypothetical protein
LPLDLLVAPPTGLVSKYQDYRQIINKQKVVVVVGGGFVVGVVVGGFVVVVVVVVVDEGFVVVVDEGLVVVDEGFVVVVDEGLVVVDEGFVVVVVEIEEGLVVEVAVEGVVVVVDGDSVAEGDVVEVAVDPDEVDVDRRVVVVPEITVVTDADGEETIVVVGSVPVVDRTTCELKAEVSAVPAWSCIRARPPAAVVPSATDPATRATWAPAVITLPRLLNWLTIGTSNNQASGPIIQR